MSSPPPLESVELNTDALKVLQGFFCCVQYLDTDFSNLLALNAHAVCCCCEGKRRCGPNLEPLGVGMTTQEGQICELSLYCCSYGLIMPDFGKIMAVKQKCCCFALEGALPPDASIPSVVAMYGLTCIPTVGCCLPYSEVNPVSKQPQSNA